MATVELHISEGDGSRYGAGPCPYRIAVISGMDNPLSSVCLSDYDANVMTPHYNHANFWAGGRFALGCPFTREPEATVGLVEVLRKVNTAPW